MNNRIIKFKFWDKDNKEWLSGSEIEFQENGEPFDLYEKNVIYLQFTGLLDKNNKEIYEGDILYNHIEQSNHKVIIVDGHLIIKALPPNKMFDDFFLIKDDIKEYCIIGNIFENPEFLNEKDN